MTPEPENCLADALVARQDALAEALVERHDALQPGLATRYGQAGRQRCVDDAKVHLAMLSQALRTQRPEFFCDYVEWAQVMMERRGIAPADLMQHLAVLRDLLRDELGTATAHPSTRLIDHCIRELPAMRRDPPTFLDDAAPLSALARDYLDLALHGQRRLASQRVLAAVEGGASVRAIYLEVFQRCQREIGRLWQTNQISVAQEHHVSAVTQLTMAQLYALVAAGSVQRSGRVVATCAVGDLHEIGLRMIADLLEEDGWDVTYLGAKAAAAAARQVLVDRQASLLLISASLTLHLSAVQSLIDLVRADPACRDVKILVGGHPFNRSPQLWKQMGADGHASDAEGAVALARGFRVVAA